MGCNGQEAKKLQGAVKLIIPGYSWQANVILWRVITVNIGIKKAGKVWRLFLVELPLNVCEDVTEYYDNNCKWMNE